MKQYRYPLFISLFLILILSACNLPEKTEDNADTGNLLLTAAAETVSAALTENPPAVQEDTPQPVTATEASGEATNTPISTNTLVPALSPTLAQACNSAIYIDDVTIPDYTEVKPGTNFTKTWEIKNTGRCTWNTSYSLIYAAEISGTAKLGEPASVNLTKDVAPGETIEISVDLTAPTAADEYKSDWLLRDDSGITFYINGTSIYLIITVPSLEDTATPAPSITPGGPTVTPEPTATTAPSVYSSTSSQAIAQTNSIDFDSGNVTTSGADMTFVYSSDDDKKLSPQNGASAILWGLGEPSYSDCLNASTNGNSITVDSTLPGQYVCYETSDGRPGYFYIHDLSPSDKTETQVLDLLFVTWNTP